MTEEKGSDGRKLLLSTHSLDPCLWGESNHPAFGRLVCSELGKSVTSEAGCGGGVRSILLLPLVARCLETIDVCIWCVCFYVCCSYCVGACENVCCVAAVIKYSVF